jgi:hypothetical protein
LCVLKKFVADQAISGLNMQALKLSVTEQNNGVMAISTKESISFDSNV